MSTRLVATNPNQPGQRASVSIARGFAAAISATVVVLLGLSIPTSLTARAATDDPPAPSGSAKVSITTARADFLSEIRQLLIKEQDRMVEFATRVARHEEEIKQLEDQLPSRETVVEAAKARNEKAKLAREAAEMKLKEYIEGTFPQDPTLADLEIKIAEEEVASTREETKQAEDHLARIKNASTGSVADITFEHNFERNVFAAKLGERRAAFSLEEGQSKKKVLLDYTKKKTKLELLSEVEKCRSDELAQRATWGLELSKTRKLERDIKQKSIPADLQRAMVVLDKAVGVQQLLRQELDVATKQEKIADGLQTEMKDLASQLRALVDEADGIRAALELDALKSHIHRSSGRPDTPKK
jgi:hypothetical protein